jgi:hypothetical protein
VIQAAKDRLAQLGRRTVLFLDEIHRFNKAQQDALLPAVENGWIVLVGATTENPSFEVNSPLMSRSLLFRLEALFAACQSSLAFEANDPRWPETPRPFRIPILDLPIYGYGLMVVLGFLAAIQTARYLARRVGINPEFFVNAGLVAIISGVIRCTSRSPMMPVE